MRVFANRVLRRIFGPKGDEVTGEWRKLHNEELRDLYSSPSVIRMIKSRRIRLARYVAKMGTAEECVQDIGAKARKENQDVVGWIILRWILERERGWSGLIRIRVGPNGWLL
jgi:hypothetical protein